MNTKAFEQAMMQAVIFEIAAGIAITILLFWATYWVIKAGVRDGIREANLRSTPPARSMAPHGYKWALVPEEAQPLDLKAER